MFRSQVLQNSNNFNLSSAYYMAKDLKYMNFLIIPAILWHGYHYYPHFTDEETEVQTGCGVLF